MALEEYRRKRDFHKTPEPAGAAATRGEASIGLSFVIQKHAARRLHYDFRLELDGVLKSWAVPKGPSLDPGEKRLAVHVEDHPLDYGAFEGVIPQGEYGGGTVLLWDRGTWIPADPDPDAAYRKGSLKFTLQGDKLHGKWALVRMGGKAAGEGRENWLLIKERDEDAAPQSGDAVVAEKPLSVASGRSLDAIAADRDWVWHSNRDHSETKPAPAEASAKTSPPGRVPGARKGRMPDNPKPQLATVADKAPEGAEWLHEIKYDGYRLLARIERGAARLITRGGLDWTAKFPALARRLAELELSAALIDGELVYLEPDGTTSFSGLQDAISSTHTDALTFFAFDLIYCDGWDLAGAALEDRKAALAAVIPPQAQNMLRYSDHQIDRGPEFLNQACSFGLEGIVSKRRAEPYRSGRSRSWLKVKCRNREEFVIIGFSDPEGSREGFGALLIGYYDPQHNLRYGGRVGTGFNAAQLVALRKRLDALARPAPTVALPKGVSRKGVHWIEPRLVAEVEFASWTADAILRQASFQGLREDKETREVIYDPQSRAPVTPKMRPKKPAARPVPQKAETAPEPARDGSMMFEGVRLTHPERILYPGTTLTKLDVARYYAAVSDWILPQLYHRLLTLVRSPAVGKRTFYQKHIGDEAPEAIKRFELPDEDEKEIYPFVEDLPGLIGLVQMGVLEIHPWGSRVEKLETPDRITIDLDPDEGLPWQRVTETAVDVRDGLLGIGLKSFAKTTGGKGLHVVVPLTPKLNWDEVKAFAKWLADSFVAQRPEDFTANMAKRARRGRIYIDYLRNGRGATAVGAYTPRDRPGAPVSMPVFWEEVEKGVRPDEFTVDTVQNRLSTLESDPWAEMGKLRQSISAAVRRQVGI